MVSRLLLCGGLYRKFDKEKRQNCHELREMLGIPPTTSKDAKGRVSGGKSLKSTQILGLIFFCGACCALYVFGDTWLNAVPFFWTENKGISTSFWRRSR